MFDKKAKATKLDQSKIEQMVKDEDDYISGLLTVFDVPESFYDNNVDSYVTESCEESLMGVEDNGNGNGNGLDHKLDLLEVMKNKHENKRSKPNQRTLLKREEKQLRKVKALKRKLSPGKALKNATIKEIKKENSDIGDEDVKPAKKAFNEDGKMVFSKFEFAAHPQKAKKRVRSKISIEKNPKQLLLKIKKQEKEINELIEQGDIERAELLKQDRAWQKAFEKTAGLKIKDDKNLLKKTIKRRQLEKKKSKSDWKERQGKVQQDIAGRQKKRQENIDKKKAEKKKHKMKRLAKRGRIIPGY